VKKVQCICVVVDKNDSAAGFEDKSEQGAGSGRRPGIVQQPLRDLRSLRRDFGDEAIATVSRKYVAAFCDSQAEWAV
jgi:hypothetical protein